MNILFLTMSDVNSISSSGIYSDLMRELIKRGNEVFIVSPLERREGKKTHVIKGVGYQILKVKTLNLQKTNIVEKGMGQLLLESQFQKAIDKYWSDIKFDLVLYSTPPITFNKVIEKIKKRDGAKSYLMLKDIFPQNAVDLGMMKPGSFIYNMFRKKEEKLYELSDRIGTMSPANSEYLIKHNPSVDPSKVEVCPNSIELTDIKKTSSEEKEDLLKKLGIPSSKTIFIYGGNLGKPQGIDFLLEVVKANEKEDKSFIIIIGNGTEFHKVQHWFEENKPVNSLLMESIPKDEYDKLVKIADVGLIFLDHRFTIPNYPSRLLSYLENSQPVLCATDPNTDIGKIAEKEGYGLWCESNNLEEFMAKLRKLSGASELREAMGKKGRAFLEANYTVDKTADIILKDRDMISPKS